MRLIIKDKNNQFKYIYQWEDKKEEAKSTICHVVDFTFTFKYELNIYLNIHLLDIELYWIKLLLVS